MANPIDPLLQPYLDAPNESQSQRLLQTLVSNHAEPLIRKIVEFKLRPSNFGDAADSQDIEDVQGEAILLLLTRLRDFKENPQDNLITNFRSYAAVITYRTCSEHLRRKYPQRHNLKDRVRHMLVNNSKFDIWESEDRSWLCGLKNRSKRSLPVNAEILEELRNGSFNNAGLLKNDGGRIKTADLIAAVFEYARDPIKLDDLVDVIAEFSGDKDLPSRIELDAERESRLEDKLADPRASIDAEYEQRVYLQRLWAEMRELPPRQRAAILLNLKDEQGRGVIALFPLTGIASMVQIAAALEMKPEKFAELWNDLPMDDAAIAGQLGLNRQQVINLRKSARERLARRMQAF